ncbi:MAG: 3-deoxy-8-phosphooctulonate synthase [Thermodesulfobacteriota bacterium]|nr:3-deoxy-8-phosphooctulonate synthase [Thermodesulfobacteriota bacterium]
MKKKIVQVGNVRCGDDKLFLISGPCVVEDEDIMLKTAEQLKLLSEKLDLPLIYKSSVEKDNRSAVANYRGPGFEKGLEILAKVKKETGLPLISDIHYPWQADIAAEVLDVLQIPAYLCMQTSLIEAVAKTGKPVNIKHGQFLAPENMDKPLQKALDFGNDKVMLTERGYAFGYNDLIVDPRSFYHLNKTGCPVIFDITHSVRKYGIPSANPEGGARHYLKTLAMAGTASGVDGLFIEAHPEPAKALCDASSMIALSDMEEFLKPLLEIHATEVKYRV